MTQFYQTRDLPTTLYVTPEMLESLEKTIEALDGKTYTLDTPYQTALAMCKTAAARPQQYTVQPDGSWKKK